MMQIQLDSEQQQQEFGAQLGSLLPAVAKGGVVIYLQGDLGAGKTTLVRGMLRGLGWQKAVKSPTYTIMEPYELDVISLYHFDLYRLADPEELDYLGLRDMVGHGVLVFEWPERGVSGLPPADLLIEIAHRQQGRELNLTSCSASGRSLLQKVSG
ncbi:tRNA (adenosine(37)-N6)-threonylcarbamoyltransferase complex ATPase subunit type 1 TsaE [Solemya velum gill symbiont]|uniref:tRNA threonylcarbamoyladenosine biosynthesis protein TsaE n=2 Tax=Solemya velum gill symbiont TaxID=2340 RepID=A0A1T2IS99_SOVGS|nr:tRNA (adenosine(37)-N6)-threonylcarbamoyltransferase complex ATPase subunit type 1 TsaE [Solemya velum gill symbiont]OOY38734.1 tRNA (adenosine(37)-N6)-threonylcarbamoyltransferase complex ATPase subunit type 1 TsaE [Solemya velum gill symbiont]OOY40121.1 tRNA (adenosine(37)-N6)-threonylcarbamoyltransferase complex ATPase subunit type 1 TsaE [Solemya velum gill symbiont]OOY47055.1 tRNA (adenosine(37)-N6)-threonylcarbamoyltransferase complex ATPase subunit type 1 TsaE [Solemya velum gill symbi